MTRFARPAGSPLAGLRFVQLALPVVEPRSGFSSPCGEYKEKSPYLRTGSHLEYGGEGDSNPRYVAVYTLSVRAPSATRTPHHIVLLLTLGGQRGATIGSCVKTVKHIFFFLCRSLTHEQCPAAAQRAGVLALGIQLFVILHDVLRFAVAFDQQLVGREDFGVHLRPFCGVRAIPCAAAQRRRRRYPLALRRPVPREPW